MNLSRKEFFRKSLFSIGEAVGTVAGLLKPLELPEIQETDEDVEFTAVPSPHRVATSRPAGHCLAANSGCFACIERCEAGAISLVIGKGILVNPEACTGCGTCEYVCPVAPKAVVMITRDAEHSV